MRSHITLLEELENRRRVDADSNFRQLNRDEYFAAAVREKQLRADFIVLALGSTSQGT